VSDGPQSAHSTAHVVGCGMYAFTDELQQSWSEFFSYFGQECTFSGLIDQTLELQFSSTHEIYTAESSLIAQTCGFPYLKHWRDSHIPVCVPVFDIEGCEDQRYRSWFIKRKSSQRQDLEAFRNMRVAINGLESNSGMNVLRFAACRLSNQGRFFSEVKVTGAHYQSMFAVANGDADIAAIDAVSFYFACQKYPDLLAQIDVFAQSATTVGLPFIQKRGARVSAESITRALNTAVDRYRENTPNPLRLRRFQGVGESAYLPMLQMEQSAIEAGYRTLA